MTARDGEKRGNPRVAADLTLRAGESSDGAGVLEMQVSNVSLGGVYCRSARDLPPMTRIEVTLELPQADGVSSVRSEAVVVRSERRPGLPGGAPYQLALWFQHMEPADRERLMRFLGTFEH